MQGEAMPKAIRVKSGETFQVPLTGQAGTGFRWEVELSDAASQPRRISDDRA